MIVTTELARQLTELEARHAALVAALDALVKRMRTDNGRALHGDHWALVLTDLLRQHREG